MKNRGLDGLDVGLNTNKISEYQEHHTDLDQLEDSQTDGAPY